MAAAGPVQAAVQATAQSESGPAAAAGHQSVARLLAVPEESRRDDWLRAALQVAVALELSTIPPYLCGWWSIRDRGSEAARLIRRIVGDEMFHLGVVCNLLVAVGGRPRIRKRHPPTPARCPAVCTPD